MRFGKTISAIPKAFMCLVLVFALMVFPPAATHAASGTHDGHHASSVHSDGLNESHTDTASASHAMHGVSDPALDADAEEHESGQCCNGICISVVLEESGPDFADQITVNKYLTLHEQTSSLEVSGFLRPPQHLI